MVCSRRAAWVPAASSRWRSATWARSLSRPSVSAAASRVSRVLIAVFWLALRALASLSACAS